MQFEIMPMETNQFVRMIQKYMRTSVVRVVLPCLVAVAIWSCEDGPALDDLVKSMVVRTTYAENIDFSAYRTFSMPIDTLGLASNATDDTVITGDYARQVSQRIRTRLVDTGYEAVGSTDDPDLLIKAYIVDNQGVYQSYTYGGLGYPGSFYSGYYGYGGLGGYYGYPLLQSFAYQTGTLVIEMLDLKNPAPDGRFQVVWLAQMGDVYNSVDPFDKALEAVEQAFTQSEYLGR